jgi:osmotically inducible protein OsmC
LWHHRGPGSNVPQTSRKLWLNASGERNLAKETNQMETTKTSAIDAEVDPCSGDGGFFLQARLNVSLPGVEHEVDQTLVDAAHQMCPYSKATRGNVSVVINLV